VVPHYPLPEQTATASNKSNEMEEKGIWFSFMGGRTKFIATDSRSFLFSRRADGETTVFGDAQLDWLKKELKSAAEDVSVHGVVIMLSFSWKTNVEFT